jgi:hypothetical protein
VQSQSYRSNCLLHCVLFVCLSVCHKQLGSHWMQFHDIQVWLKLDTITDSSLEDQHTFISTIVTSITVVTFAGCHVYRSVTSITVVTFAGCHVYHSVTSITVVTFADCHVYHSVTSITVVTFAAMYTVVLPALLW